MPEPTSSQAGRTDATERPYPAGVEAIFEIARRLRAPDGCPWDREQTPESLRPYLLEERGDVLLQVAMHSAIAEEEGRFDAARVSEAAAAKMVARHPHVFGHEQVADPEEVLANWEQRKADEAARAGREQETPLDRVPIALPALAWTYGMQKRAARVGFDFDTPGQAAGAIAEEAQELADAQDREQAFREVGDLLFAMVTMSRKLRIDPEDALRSAGQRFRDRFAAMARDLRERGVSYRELDPTELAAVWDRTR